MKSSSVYSPFTALTLKIVGLIMILYSLLDYIILAIPFNALQREWQLGITTQVVDRGITPMVGIALLMAGYWIDSSIGALQNKQKPLVQDLRFWTLLLSSLLGLIYLLLVPLHINNTLWLKNQDFQKIEQQATQASAQLDNRIKQVDALVKDPQKLSQLDKAITSGQVQGEQLAQAQAIKQQLQTFKQDPKALGQQVETVKTQIRNGKQQAEQQATTKALKLGLRTGLVSALLALGYIAIGWMGLRSLGS
jgi:hypothetical protein